MAPARTASGRQDRFCRSEGAVGNPRAARSPCRTPHDRRSGSLVGVSGMSMGHAGISPVQLRTGDQTAQSARIHEAVLRAEYFRLDIAVASSCGRAHAVNEDGYSGLDGGHPLFVVADGVGSGAMAACASRELVRILHQTLDGREPDVDAVRTAVLDADRHIGRIIARETDGSGAATLALCAATN